jgi:formate-dependent nitrite reductase membrane component NrfD
VSAASTSGALILLLAHRFGWNVPAVGNLRRMERLTIGLELLVLLALVLSLGSVARGWMNVWGILLAFVVAVGTIVPLALTWGGRELQRMNVTAAAVLVLLGGLLLRVVVVFSAQSV